MTAKLLKAELHAHLEGSIPVSSIRRLGRKNDVQLPENIFDGENYRWRDFPHFLEVYDLICGVFKSGEDFASATYEYLELLSRSGVIYSEIIISPVHAEKLGLGYSEYLAGISEGASRAEQNYDICCRLIATIVRGYGLDGADQTIQLLQKNPSSRVVGLHLAGDEAFMNHSDFARHFSQAKDIGLGLAAHAGEILGPESVRQALSLGVSRIGHGVSAIMDKSLVAELVERQICLEVCPTSNICTAVHFPSYQSHPLKKLFDAGVATCINSDDPPFFDSWIDKEYQRAKSEFGFTDNELDTMTATAIKHSFAEPTLKRSLEQKLNARSDESN